MLGTDISVLKWGGGIVGGIVAFFTLKKFVVADIEAKLKLELDLVRAEIELVKLALLKIEGDTKTKLNEKEHKLMCDKMQIQIKSLEDCIKLEFKGLHKRMDERRITNGDTPT